MSPHSEGTCGATTPTFAVSVVRNTRADGKLCKVLSYDASTDRVVARTEAFLSEGRVTEVAFDRISAFMSCRAALAKDSALMMGKPIYSEARIVTQNELEGIPPRQRQKERSIARDRAHIFWPDGPTLVLLDLDRPDQFPTDVKGRIPTTPDEYRELLIEVFPGLAHAQMAWAPSSSSNIHLGDRELQGLRGQRFYLVIDSGVEVPQFRQALHDGLVSRQLAWYEISKSGNLLKKFPFDLNVYQPEHLDFAAGPECLPPLEWRPETPQVWNDGGPYLAGSTLPAATEEDRRRIDAVLGDARRTKRDAANAMRKKWIEETGHNIASCSQLAPEQAEAVAEAAVERGILLPEFVLTDSSGQAVTVGELLEDPAKHHGRRFHDPLEPEYRGDARIAVFLANDQGQPRIHSHAHGGQSWKCGRSVPVVRLGQIHRAVDQISRALELDDCALYRNGDALVWVNEVDARMQPLDVEGLGLRLQRGIKVERHTTSHGWVPADLPPRVLKAVLSEVPLLPVPKLNAVVQGPYALADGSIVDTPGYDPASQVVYVANSPYPPTVRRDITRSEAKDALRRLWLPVQHFPLETDVDRGVLLAAVLSTVIRPSIGIAPGYYISAHAAGTGKTLLAQVIGAIQTGHPVAASPLPQDEEERRKHIFANLRQGSQFLFYDNTARGSVLDSPVLAQLITSPLIEGRILGVSTVEHRPNRMALVLTGNNLVMRGDLNRRILPVRLDAGLERPWERQFAFHPVHYALANCLALRIAALELIRAWGKHGASLAPGGTGFPEWDAVVRSTVVWVAQHLDIGVGFADPIEALQAAYLTDPETDVLGNLLEAWWAVLRDREVQLRDVEGAAADPDPPLGAMTSAQPQSESPALALRNAIDEAVERPGSRYSDNAARLGMYLAQHEERIVRGLKVTRGGTRGGVRKWRVVRTNEHVVVVLDASRLDPASAAVTPSEVGRNGC